MVSPTFPIVESTDSIDTVGAFTHTFQLRFEENMQKALFKICLLYTSDAADE